MLKNVRDGGWGGGGERNQLASFFPNPSLFLCSNDKTF